MSFAKPDKDTLIFECDYCHGHLRFYADEGQPVGDFPECSRRAQIIGWTKKKVVGYSWEHYCEECSKFPEDMKRPTTRPGK